MSISRWAASWIKSRRKSFDALTRRHWRHGHISPSLLAITLGRSIMVSVIVLSFVVVGL
jgi:hypothetical protein